MLEEQDQQLQLNFTKIYFKQTPWAHLDIAGMAFQIWWALNSGGATGYGVRLLNKLMRITMNNVEQTLSIIKPDAVERNYEVKLKKCLKVTDLLF